LWLWWWSLRCFPQVLAGVGGVFAMGPVLDHTHCYWSTNAVLAICSCVATAFMGVASETDSGGAHWAIFVSSCVFG
jgi:hypothetical protein